MLNKLFDIILFSQLCILVGVVSASKFENVCLTPECVKTAGRMLSILDTTVDPCVDFFAFSCGRWIQENPMPITESRWDQGVLLDNKLMLNLKTILERNDKDTKYTQMAKNYYSACMSQNYSEDSSNLKKLKELAKILLKNFQMKTNLGQILGSIGKIIGGNFLISTDFAVDLKNLAQEKRYIIEVGQPTFGIHRNSLLSSTNRKRKAYKKLIVKFWSEIFKSTDCESEIIAENILNFEIKLAIASKSNEEYIFEIKSLSELENLTSDFPELNWREYFNTRISESMPHYEYENKPILISDFGYLQQIGKILKSTDANTLHNYFIWRIIHQLGSHASAHLKDIQLQNEKESNVDEQFPKPRWMACTEEANKNFGFAISSIYVGEYFQEILKEKVQNMSQDILDAFYDILDKLDWIRDSKEIVKDKAKKMIFKLGYPDWIKNQTLVEKYYDGLKLTDSKNHFQNHLDILKFLEFQKILKLGSVQDRNKWPKVPTVLAAEYSPDYNAITIPTGFLAEPYLGMPLESLNYGAIGMIIGHEITHGFENKGLKYNSDGYEENCWSNHDMEEFKKRAECFVHQYDSYYDDQAQMNLNGSLTMDENISDNGGLRQAFQAYQNYIERNGQEMILPGLNYTSDQLFFLSFSQIHCGTFRTESLQDHIKSNAHSPDKYRVKGSIANSVNFSKAWNCQEPQSKSNCKIW